MFIVRASTGAKEVMLEDYKVSIDNFERYVKYRGSCKCRRNSSQGKAIYSSFITLANDSEYGLSKACKDDAKVVKGGKFTTDVLNGLLVVVPKQKDDGSNTDD
jgi:hypothetical protein